MPVNLELKARIPSREIAGVQARQAGACRAGSFQQTDTYYHVPRGRLKIREQSGETSELIYYERPEERAERWSTYRKESLESAGAIKDLLGLALGVRTVVRKERELFLLDGARVHLDRVEGLGDFLEFEVPVGGIGEGSELMKRLRTLLSVEESAIIKQSYSDMILEKSISPES